MYPQYKEITTVKTEVEKAKPKGDAYKELMEMIGLTEAKKVILQALNYHKAQKLFADKGMKVDLPAMHMVFTGNPGLRSRIAYHVPFADYSVEELCSIAALTARKKGLHLDDQAQEKLASVFETARRQADFGNGRYVRNILEKAKMAQATRLLTQDYESLTQKEITTLCAEDIEMPEIAAPAKQRIGFSA